jgi:CheY-like chemotaxis protein
LVVDDSLEQAECLARLLEAIGHSATFVINPLDALDALDALQPEVVLIDIDMPQVDGWALAGMLRERRLAARPRIVAVSGQDPRAESSRLFDAYLLKPVKLEALAEVFALSP